MDLLRRIKLSGFMSIREIDLELGPLNVLIGANGSGKSNLVTFFRMLGFAMTYGSSEDAQAPLQTFVGAHGTAVSLLHYGPKVTSQMEAVLEYDTASGRNWYGLRLVHAAGDKLMFADEWLRFVRRDWQGAEPGPHSLGAGHFETALPHAGASGDKNAQAALSIMRRWRVFQFHDTSSTAGIRLSCYVGDNRYLRSNGGNLAAYLYALKETRPEYYRRIVATIREVAPFFGDFVLEPGRLDRNRISLEWREAGNEYVFGPHQLSDGTLRMMALVTVLLQPEDKLPSLMVIDEPELGLHPFAIEVLAELLRSVSRHTQIILATQSVSLVDRMDPEMIVVVDRRNGASEFRRLDAERLGEWLREYSLGELWEKNVIGGRPAR